MFLDKEVQQLFKKYQNQIMKYCFTKDIPNNQHLEEHVPKGGGIHRSACIFKNILKYCKGTQRILKNLWKRDDKKTIAFI